MNYSLSPYVSPWGLAHAGLYTKALKAQPNAAQQAVLYSNRSASLLKLNKVAKALADAEEVIRLKPEWDKAWTRRASAREAAGQRDEALQDYEHALELKGGNAEVAAKAKALRQALGKLVASFVSKPPACWPTPPCTGAYQSPPHWQVHATTSLLNKKN